MDYSKIASHEALKQTTEALTKNGFTVTTVDTQEQAKVEALKLIPAGAEVMNMTSVTLVQTGIVKEITESGKYQAVHTELKKMDRKTQSLQMQKLGAAPEYVIGSVSAVTQDGIVLIASNTGSQLPAYAYGSVHVIWLVGAQKIVSNLDAALKRIWDYVLPLETERAKKAYGLPETWDSFPSKILMVNRENTAGRINIILVKEVLGF